tara:strand:- start:1134 stop:3458 length:2325 start_codon:yes stop_codon:yes gene_type:complete
MSDLLNIGISGLLTYRSRSNLIEKNISNVNTENYHRQTMQQRSEMSSSLRPLEIGMNYGDGVNFGQINRAYNQFIEREYNYSAEFNHYSETMGLYTKELDSAISTLGGGIDTSIQNTFQFMSSLELEPSEGSLRYSLMTETQVLTNSIGLMDTHYSQQYERLSTKFETYVRDLNQILNNVAFINQTIMASPQLDGSLLDARDRFIKQVNGYSGVTAIEDGKGLVTVLMGGSKTLVDKSFAAQLRVVEGTSDPRKEEIEIKFSQSREKLKIEDLGGHLAGLAQYRDEILLPAQDHFDVLALQLSAQLNHQQSYGFNENGNVPSSWFTEINDPDVVGLRGHADKRNKGTAQVQSVLLHDIAGVYTSEPNLDLPDVRDIVGNDYTLKVITPPQVSKTTPDDLPPALTDRVKQGEFVIINNATGAQDFFYFPQPDPDLPVALKPAKPGVTQEPFMYEDVLNQKLFKHRTDPLVQMNFDGFNVVLDDPTSFKLQEGDQFLIRPFAKMAKNMEVLLQDSADISVAKGLDYDFQASSIGKREQPDRDTPNIHLEHINRTHLLQKKYLPEGNKLRFTYDRPAAGNHQLLVHVVDAQGVVIPNAEDSDGKFQVIDLGVDTAIELDDEVNGLSVKPPFRFETFGMRFALDSNQLVAKSTPIESSDQFSFQIDFAENDNRNMHDFAQLMVQHSMKYVAQGPNEFSFIDFFQFKKETVGTHAQNVKLLVESSSAHMRYTEKQMSNLIDVNIDEEGAKMVQFEQAYKASARMISTSSQLIQSLFDVM